jgi:hypothetical protein
MIAAEAKRVLASYLAGERVSAEELEQARGMLGAERWYRRFLDEELGTHGEWVSECDAFLERLGEFSELAGEERARRMPSLAAHVEECAACRHAYWSVKPLWVARVVEGARGLCRSLAEQIRLGVDQAGRLLEEGLCPPSLTLQPVGVTAALPGAVEAERREWELRDEDAGCLIRLGISGAASGQVAVSCAVEGLEPPERLRVDVRGQTGDTTLFSGTFAEFQVEPFILPPGAWLIRIRSVSAPEPRIWEIPLTIGTGPSTGESG